MWSDPQQIVRVRGEVFTNWNLQIQRWVCEAMSDCVTGPFPEGKHVYVFCCQLDSTVGTLQQHHSDHPHSCLIMTTWSNVLKLGVESAGVHWLPSADVSSQEWASWGYRYHYGLPTIITHRKAVLLLLLLLLWLLLLLTRWDTVLHQYLIRCLICMYM